VPIATSGGAIVGLGVLYLVLLLTLGIMSIRKGHWIMFIVGIFIPLFWLIGALMPPVNKAD
jgi:hypothetical protein